MINYESSVPLHQQIAEELTNSLSKGTYRPGDKLPSEKRLCEQYGVSRITVRQALRTLLDNDLVYSVQGIGTFVKSVKVQQQIQRIVRFSQILREKGVSGHTIIHKYTVENAGEQSDNRFANGCSRLELIGYMQSAPVVYYSSCFNKTISHDAYMKAIELEKEGVAFSSYDLYGLLGISLNKIDQRISAASETDLTRAVFGEYSSPAYLVLETDYYSKDTGLLEHKIAYYRSDIYSFHLEREM